MTSHAFPSRLSGLLSDRYTRGGSDHFGEISGAATLLTKFTRHHSWCVAIATGCLAGSAKFKMQKAGLPKADIPIASAEDGPSREAIVRTAIERAKARYNVRHFDRIVSVGDAVWDVKTARRLELPFVGVAAGERAERLRDNGATTVIEHFLNDDHCMRCFEGASIPELV